MPLSLNELYAFDSDENLQKELHTYKVYELQDYLIPLEEDQDTTIESLKKKKRLQENIERQIDIKIEEQIKNFGKPLTRAIEDHLEEFFPNITDIHQKVMIEDVKETPMQVAFFLDRLDVIKDLVELKSGLNEYLGEKDFFDSVWSYGHYSVPKQCISLEFIIKILSGNDRLEFLSRLYKEYLKTNCILSKFSHLFVSEHFNQNPNPINLFEGAIFKKWELHCKGWIYGKQAIMYNGDSVDYFSNFYYYILFIIKIIQKEHFLNTSKESNIEENAKKLTSDLMGYLKEIIFLDRDSATFNQKKFNVVFSLTLQLIKKLYDSVPAILQESFDNEIKKALKKSPQQINTNILKKLLGNNPVETEAFVFFIECEVFLERDIDQILRFFINNHNDKGVNLIQEYYPELTHAIIMKIVNEKLQSSQAAPTSVEQAKALYALRFIKDFSESDKKALAPFLLANSLKPTDVAEKQVKKESDSQLLFDCAIDDRLFAHIHNDYMLTGTRELQGHHGVVTFKYLYNYFSRYINGGDKDKCDLNKDDLRTIQQKMLPTIAIFEKIDEICQEPREVLESIGNYRVYELVSFVTDLLMQNKGELLIPGGWRGLGSSPGHAMLYEFKHREDGWYFLIRNTGAGLEYHQNLEQSNDVYYSSIKGYKIPFSLEDFQKYPRALNEFIRLLVEPNLLPAWINKGYNENKLYNSIIECALKLGFIEENAKIFSEKLTKVQRSGICSYKVFMSSYLKTHPFSGVHDYEKIHLDVKSYSLEDYSTTYASRKSEAKVQRQIRFAIQNMARMLPKQQSLGLLSQDQTTGLLQQLQNLEGSLDTLVPHRKLDLPQYQPKAELLERKASIIGSKNQDIRHPKISPIPVIDLSVEQGKNVFRKQPILEILTYSKGNALDNLEVLLTNCRYNYTEGFEGLVLLHIDKFYLSIPFENHQYLELSAENQRKTVAMLAALNSLYASSAAIQNSKPFAKYVITLNKGISVAISIMEQYFLQSPDIKSKVWQRLSYYTGLIQDFLSPSPYFISCDPEKNRNYTEFGKLLVQNKEAAESDPPPHKSYVHSLIDSEKNILSDLVERNKMTKRKKESQIHLMDDLNKAVYYFLENNKELRKNQKYNQIMADFKLFILFTQLKREYILFRRGQMDGIFQIKSVDVYWEDVPQEHQFQVWEDRVEGFVCHINSDLLEGLYDSTQSYPIERTQPSILDESTRKCLVDDRSESNIVVAQNEAEKLNEKACLLRTLKNVRLHPQTQVAATIDFMKRHFLRLNQEDIQNYIFCNLFWFDLFEQQIADDMSVIDDLISLIDKGFKTNIQGATIKDPLFFFMKVAVSLRQILTGLNKQNLEPALRLSSALDITLENLIAQVREKPRTEYNVLQLQKIYGFYIWNNRLGLVQDHFVKEKDVLNFFDAIVFRRNYADPEMVDPYVEAEVNESIAMTMLAVSNYIKDLNKEAHKTLALKLTEIVASIVGKNKVNDGKGEWHLYFPVCQFMDAQGQELACVDITKGSVFTQGKSYMPLPSSVYNNPLFTYFFTVKAIPAMVSADNKTFEFSINDIDYRFHALTGSDPSKKECILQQKISRQGVDVWYQYIPDYDISLPLTLCHFGIQAWASVEQTNGSQEVVLINVVTKEILCFIETKTQRIYREVSMGPESQVTRQYLLQISNADCLQQYPFIAHFEDPKFIECWVPEQKDKHQNQDDVLIRLPRYDLEFLSKNINNETLYIFNKDTRYKIAVDFPRQVIPGLLAPIVLVPLAAYKDDSLKILVIIPKQEFYCVEDIADDEYYFYKFDTTQEVQRRRLYLSHLFSYKETQNPKLFYFSKTESYITYTLSEDKQLIPEDLTARLYLAYLYLAKRLPYLAFETLKTVSDHPLNLTVEQIEYLRKIVEELPASIAIFPDERSVEYKSLIESPEFSAVRMLAAAILEKQKMLSNTISFKLFEDGVLSQYILENPRFKLANKAYQALMLRITEGSYHHPFYLAPVVGQYRNLFNNIPVNIQVSFNDEKCVLQALSNLRKERGCKVYFVSSKATLPEDVELLRDVLPLFIVDEDNQLEPVSLMYVDKFSDIQKVDSMPDGCSRELLQTFIHQFYQDKEVFLEMGHPVLEWLMSKVGHTLPDTRFHAHLEYRKQALKNQQLALQSLRGLPFKKKELNVSEHYKTLVTKDVKLDFKYWNFSLSKFHRGVLNNARQGIDVAEWSLDASVSDFLSSFFRFCQIAIDPGHAQHADLSLKVNGYLNYIAYAERNPELFNIKESLVAVLGFVLHNPKLFSVEVQNLVDNAERAKALECLTAGILQLAENKRYLSASYQMLRREPGKLLSLPSSMPLEEPLPHVLSENPASKFSWEFMDAYLKQFQAYVKEIQKSQTDDRPPISFNRTNPHQTALEKQFREELEQDYQEGVKENRRLAIQNAAGLLFYQKDKEALIQLHGQVSKNCVDE